ncbi:MAG: hypothetical protein UZ22_OP11002000572 [Microgenomates bacterium OLB23]|nr:MAG: hypothetical protein UZ22_OP11002000572 [Microgenomates bacterium OLB23]
MKAPVRTTIQFVVILIRHSQHHVLLLQLQICVGQPITVISATTRMASNSGFALIELVIVMSIIVTIMVGGLSSYRSFDQIKRLEADSEAFIEGIELAKKMASSGEKPCVDYEGQYSVTWSTSHFQITPVGCTSLQSYTLKGNTFDGGTASVTFNPLGRGTSLNADLCLLMRNTYHNQCQQITIEVSGTATSQANPQCICN